MKKYVGILTVLVTIAISGVASVAVAAVTTPRATSQYIKRDTYNYMYPYMNNQMRTDLNPGVTISQSTNPMDVVVKTRQMGNSTSTRRVVPRKNTAATARAATSTPTQAQQQTNRRVVARRATNTNVQPNMARGNRRTNPITTNTRNASNSYTTTVKSGVSTARCMADYTECMNRYCERPDTEYNRCYCSAKLSQIDAKYQPAIQELITKILTIKSTDKWSDNEMNEYWMKTVGGYTAGENSWTNLDSALNINWASLESTVRGQNAFTMGHEYCVQHLNNCYYMSSNLRDAYRSEISRDCAIYEQSLQSIKTAAESVLEYYDD